jgi:hypothetical protein
MVGTNERFLESLPHTPRKKPPAVAHSAKASLVLNLGQGLGRRFSHAVVFVL